MSRIRNKTDAERAKEAERIQETGKVFQVLENRKSNSFGDPVSTPAVNDVEKVEKEACVNCRYYFGGRCRRYPPVADAPYRLIGMFIQVRLDEWCGEYSPKPKQNAP
jgi:hypothetical protein